MWKRFSKNWQIKETWHNSTLSQEWFIIEMRTIYSSCIWNQLLAGSPFWSKTDGIWTIIVIIGTTWNWDDFSEILLFQLLDTLFWYANSTMTTTFKIRLRFIHHFLSVERLLFFCLKHNYCLVSPNFTASTFLARHHFFS